jgi:hypothetical protein
MKQHPIFNNSSQVCDGSLLTKKYPKATNYTCMQAAYKSYSNSSVFRNTITNQQQYMLDHLARALWSTETSLPPILNNFSRKGAIPMTAKLVVTYMTASWALSDAGPLSENIPRYSEMENIKASPTKKKGTRAARVSVDCFQSPELCYGQDRTHNRLQSFRLVVIDVSSLLMWLQNSG